MNPRRAMSLAAGSAAVAGAIAWFASTGAHSPHRAGDLRAGDPQQTPPAPGAGAIHRAGWTLRPLARFSIQGRLLGRTAYAGDSASDLAPFDLAVGWGPMADKTVLERLAISQESRSYHWQYWGSPPIPEKEIIRHSANIHLIPGDSSVATAIANLRIGSVVELEGDLVEATHPRAERPWRSSLSREDEGEGACEILLTRSATEVRVRPGSPE